MPRKIPQRTCLGCQTVKPKRDMIRIIRTPEGSLLVDPTGKKAGRGAYVCPSIECLERLKKGKKLEKALGVTPTPELYEEIQRLIDEKYLASDSNTRR